MNRSLRHLLVWTPRILCLLFAAFLSLFALDVFSEFTGFWQTVGALAMHLIPSAMVLIALVIAWRWESVGGILFILLGVLYLVSRGQLHWTAYAVIAGPPFLVGILFLVNWWYRAKLRTGA